MPHQLQPPNPHFLATEAGRVAVRAQAGRTPGIVWLGGYRSDMLGTKAEFLASFAQQQGLAFTRHDYSGHGESEGRFEDGTISRWLAQSLAVFDQFTEGPQILVGSSMGAWIALRMAQAMVGRRGRVAGLVLIAPAPDFTSELVEPQLTEADRRMLAERGFVSQRSEASAEAAFYTAALLADGRENRVLTGRIDTHCPVHILQGSADTVVPTAHALRLVAQLPADDVTFSLVPGGDHRLSRPHDLEFLARELGDMIARVSG